MRFKKERGSEGADAGRHEGPDFAAPSGAPRARPFAWSRLGLVSLWVIAFALVAARVASSWEKIVGSLASAPRQETLR
jgi:hypothetical protein